jgi:hypothetical protein
MAKDEGLSRALYVRVSPSDIERLDALVERIAMASRTGLAREALRLGLALIEGEPSILIGRKLDARGGARPGAGRKPKPRKRR